MPDPLLLTGATGFVGSHVAGRLAEAGRRLRCTVRASSDLRWIDDLDVELREVDLADGAGLQDALEGVRDVIHVAGVTRAPRDELFRRVNVEGTRRLARAALRAGVRRFVFLSSLAARGPDGAERPASAYGRSKRRAEEAIRRPSTGRERGAAGRPGASGAPPGDGGAGDREGSGRDLEVVVLRPGGVYGPRDTDLLSLFRLAARGWVPVVPGSGVVQPIYVEDVVRAVVRALEAEDPGFGPWPLAGEGRYRWPELAEGLGEALGRRVRTFPVPGPVLTAAGAVAEAVAGVLGRPPGFDRRTARDLARHSWTCDPSPAADALGWGPRVGLGDGLARTARWYRGEGWL